MKLLDRFAIAILVAVGVWMVWAAGRYSVFDDEAFSCQRYVLPMGRMVLALWDGVEPDPPLYYFLQNLSVRIVGVGPRGLRALSIVMFLAGLLAMRAAGHAWYGERVGKTTMLLCALHPAHLFFGFAARWYSTMFFMVALLLWVTGRIREIVIPLGDARGLDRRRGSDSLPRADWRWWIAWGMAAAGVCYTNYFGPVVVGLIWLVSIARRPCRARWLGAGLLAAALYAPWWPPFWRQATAFPQFEGGPASMLATAGRTAMALCAGNLASPRAWWVWGPMAVFAVLLCMRTWQARRRVWPVAVIVGGCFVAGCVSRTMIDKYVMTFSGAACLLVAAALSAERRPANRRETIRFAACTTLALAWLGCGVNLVTERYWSSLRWLDPTEKVVRRCMKEWGPPDGALWIANHPSVFYYRHALFAAPVQISLLVRTDEDRATVRQFTSSQSIQYIFADDWLTVHSRNTLPSERADLLVAPDRGMIDSMEPRKVVTIETAGYADTMEWGAVNKRLYDAYHVILEEPYLPDPDAEWKDRIDPRYNHPRWRITVRVWERKSGKP